MGKGSRRSVILVALPTAILVGILNVFLFFLFMVLYGHVIAPGHDESYYQAAANRFGPYASIIGGIPLMFAASTVLRGILGDVALKAGILAWCIYVAVDMAILVAVGQFGAFFLFPQNCWRSILARDPERKKRKSRRTK